MNKVFLIVVAALLLAACATGTPFKWSQARQVKEGMSREQLVQIMGAPHTVKSEGDVVRYVWVEVNGMTFATKSFSVDLVNSTVAKVPSIPADLN